MLQGLATVLFILVMTIYVASEFRGPLVHPLPNYLVGNNETGLAAVVRPALHPHAARCQDQTHRAPLCCSLLTPQPGPGCFVWLLCSAFENCQALGGTHTPVMTEAGHKERTPGLWRGRSSCKPGA